MAQMKTKKDACNATKEEFGKILLVFKRDFVNKVVDKFPDVFTGPKGEKLPVRLCLDNASIHDNEEISKPYRGIEFERVQLPVPCSDMQKVIEHSFGRLSRAFNAELNRRPGKLDMADYKTICRDKFKRLCQPKTIQKSAESLMETYKEIKKARGGWPPKAYR